MAARGVRKPRYFCLIIGETGVLIVYHDQGTTYSLCGCTFIHTSANTRRYTYQLEIVRKLSTHTCTLLQTQFTMNSRKFVDMHPSCYSVRAFYEKRGGAYVQIRLYARNTRVSICVICTKVPIGVRETTNTC